MLYVFTRFLKNMDKENYYQDTIVSPDNNEEGDNNGSIKNNLSEERVMCIRTFINFVYPNTQLYIKTADIKNHSSLFFITCLYQRQQCLNIRTCLALILRLCRTFPCKSMVRTSCIYA